MAQFATTGIGYAISCIFNPRNSQMAAVVIVLISSMLSGETFDQYLLTVEHDTDSIPYVVVLQLPKARTTTYGIESVSFLGSLLWHALPESMKKSENFAVFKRKLKSWKGLDCNCRLCKIYIADLGYL